MGGSRSTFILFHQVPCGHRTQYLGHLGSDVTSLTALQQNICINRVGISQLYGHQVEDLRVSFHVALENQLPCQELDKPVGVRHIPKTRPQISSWATDHSLSCSHRCILIRQKLHIVTESPSACAAGCCRAMFSATENDGPYCT